MLRVSISLEPQGNRHASRSMGTLEIHNDETGSPSHGNYIALLYIEKDFPPIQWRVEGIPRDISPWELVGRILSARFH